eukprot:364475-Chlamydomonas_euryale.AAC.6
MPNLQAQVCTGGGSQSQSYRERTHKGAREQLQCGARNMDTRADHKTVNPFSLPLFVMRAEGGTGLNLSAVHVRRAWAGGPCQCMHAGRPLSCMHAGRPLSVHAHREEETCTHTYMHVRPALIRPCAYDLRSQSMHAFVRQMLHERMSAGSQAGRQVTDHQFGASTRARGPGAASISVRQFAAVHAWSHGVGSTVGTSYS